MEQEETGPEGVVPMARRFARNIGSVLIIYLFVVTLMTAIAQQDVVTRLKDAKLTIGYSSALILAREADAGRGQLIKLQQNERQMVTELPKRQNTARASVRDLDAAWQDFLPLAQRFARTDACPVSLPPDNNPGARLITLGDIEQCAASSPTLPPQPARSLEAAQGEARKVRAALERNAKAISDLSTIADYLDSIRDQLKSALALTEDQKVAQASFSDTGVLTRNWFLLGGILVPLPPALLQIVLTFVSGLFGAMLLTLILVVYPRNNIVGAAKSQAFTRTLLGGPIAVCVYIVILGSTAVLGSSSGLAAAGTNYMALCAVGILAGMFSDRVAGWLSDKADAFFKLNPPTADPPEHKNLDSQNPAAGPA